VSWFERHANWSMVIGWLITGIIAFVLLFFSASESGEALFIWYGGLFTLSVLIGLWGLQTKGRTFSWIIFFLVPFGWVVILALGNKREVTTNGESSKEQAN
jgi:hypothetical protein